MEALLDVRGLCKSYGAFQLKDINLQLEPGTIMGLIGENGAGKTTLFQLILNQIHRDQGNIRIMGLDLLQNEVKIKQEIGTVLDENFFYMQLRAVDVATILRPMFAKWDDKLFRSFLSRFQLSDTQMIKEYSRGMKMKLSIAAALSHHPRLLLLDEATSGLDPVIREELLDVFLDFIQDEENGILLSSHISTDIERIADYITYLHQGVMQISGSKDEIMEHYGIVHCSNEELAKLDPSLIHGIRRNSFSTDVLVNDRQKIHAAHPSFIIDQANLDDLMRFTAKGEQQ